MRYSSKMLVDYHTNQNIKKGSGYPTEFQQNLSLEAHEEAMRSISSWEGYHPTSLHRLEGLEKELGLSRVWYKDESSRFSLGSFKALGGAYAVARLLKKLIVAEGLADSVSDDDLRNRKFGSFVEKITVTSATDGNHGRSVAWGASQFGCQCVIFIHEHVSEEREKAIQAFGANVKRVKGNYDFSVSEAEREAKLYGRYVVSDTTYPGYVDIPKDVMQGYTVMVQEAIEQMPGEVPTHIFLQAGVGGMPAAVICHYWELYGSQRPMNIIVEPQNAACVFESIKKGSAVAVEGDLDTVMAGLACGEVSLLAFDILKDAADACMVITDEAAIQVMKDCADGVFGEKIVCGESAGGGLAAMILARQNQEFAQRLGLDENSKVLLFGTEGATAPSIYQEIVGKSASEIKLGSQ